MIEVLCRNLKNLSYEKISFLIIIHDFVILNKGLIVKMFVVLLFISTFSYSCMPVPADVLYIRSLQEYRDLSGDEEDIIERIMDKSLYSEKRSYYFSKLELLLKTPTNPIHKIQKRNSDAIQDAESKIVAKKSGMSDEEFLEYVSIEEKYELSHARKWKRFLGSGAFFYATTDDVLDILVNIKVRLNGDPDAVSTIISFEDSIEKHVKIPGFSVNLIFIQSCEHDRDDIFDVNVNTGQWATSHNWASGYKVLAHELMHLMGLDDEYDRIENHAANRNMARKQRLIQFELQMGKSLPPDASFGIMDKWWLKPLHRHVCAIIGMGKKCTIMRQTVFK